MADLRKFGSTSNLIRFTVKDKTTGQGKTGLSGSTTGLIISTICDNEASATAYTQAASHIQTIATLGTYAAPSASNCRFGEVDSTNHKGLYEFQFADARFSVSSAKRLVISVNDAESSILDGDYEIELVQFDPFDTVRLGLTALPNVASGSAGAIPTTGTGANQVHVDGSGNVYAVDSNGNPLATASQVSNIAVTSAALNQTAASISITTGTETGTVTNTATVDGVYDSVADSAGTVDYYYQFSLGSTGQTGVGVNWIGYVVGVVNTIKVYAYNWGASAWDQIGSIVGIAGTVNLSQDWELTSAHTGTGGNVGLVRIRFNATGLTSSSTKTDRILCGYAVVTTFPTNFSSLSIDGSGRIDVGKTLGQAVTLDSNNVINVSAKYWAGTAITATSIPVGTAAGASGGLPKVGTAPYPASGTLSAAVWDEVNTGGTHNVTNSTGKQLRTLTLTTGVIYTATAPSQTGMTSTQIQLDTGASGTAQAYQWDIISIISGTDAGDSRIITNYTTGKVATVNSPWTTQPDSTSVFEITPTALTQVVSYTTGQDPATLVWGAAVRTLTSLGANAPSGWINAGAIASGALNGKGDWLLATGVPTHFSSMLISAAGVVTVVDVASISDSVQASPAPTTTQFAGSSALSGTNNFYNGSVLAFTSGNLKGIAEKITSYVGSTFTFTLPALPATPSSGDTFVILGRIN